MTESIFGELWLQPGDDVRIGFVNAVPQKPDRVRTVNVAVNAMPQKPDRVSVIISEILSLFCWAEALLKIARMTLTIKLDGNWSSFQLANSAPPLSVTDSALAPSARIVNEWSDNTELILAQSLTHAKDLDKSIEP